jgi:hypothetical protein
MSMDAEAAPVIPSPTIAMHKSRLRGKGKATVAARAGCRYATSIVLCGDREPITEATVCRAPVGVDLAGRPPMEMIRRDRVVTKVR